MTPEAVSRWKFLQYIGILGAGLAVARCGVQEPVQVIRQQEPRTENLSQTLLEQVAWQSAQEFSETFGIEISPEAVAASIKLTITPEEFQQAQNLFDTRYKPGKKTVTTFFVAEKRFNTPKRIYLNGADLEDIFKTHAEEFPTTESKHDFLKGIMLIALADYLSAEYFSKDFSQVIYGNNYLVRPDGQYVDDLGQQVYVDGATLNFHNNGLYLSFLKSVEMAESLVIAKYLYDRGKRTAGIDFLNKFGVSRQVFELHDELFSRLFPNYDEGQKIIELMKMRRTEGEREKIYERIGREFGGKTAKAPAMFYGFLVFNSVSIGDVQEFRRRVAG